MKTKEYKLSDLEWEQQIREVIKAYHKGIITFVEYNIKINEIIGQALMRGISYDTLNQFQA